MHRKIVILLHEDDPYPRYQSRYLIWQMCALWKQQNIEVEVVKGIDRSVDADLLFAHLNLSRVPERYAAFFSRYPRVVNGGVRDISKRFISKNLVRPGDGYTGPVIVKTNRNYGGLPELLLGQNSAGHRFASLWPPLGKIVAWGFRRFPYRWRSPLDHYRIFPEVSSVPAAVFGNDALVVEKFLPEREGELYCLRVYTFLGDRHRNSVFKSQNAIIKGSSVVSREEVPVPEEIVAVRRRLKFDYGKFDYVINEDRVVPLDTNSTPGSPPSFAEGASVPAAVELAPGIRSLWQPEKT